MTWTQRKGSKFGAKRSTYGGLQFASKKEAGYAQTLDLMVKAKQVKGWAPQKTLQLFAYGRKIARYRTDFVVTMPDGSIEFHETKGFRTPDFNLKWALLEANLDQKDFRVYNGYKMSDDLKMVLIT